MGTKGREGGRERDTEMWMQPVIGSYNPQEKHEDTKINEKKKANSK